MNFFTKRFQGQDTGDREVIGEVIVNDGATNKALAFHLKVAAPYVDLLNEVPDFRDFSTEQLLKMLPKRYHKFVPPIGENLNIREAAYEREDRMARAVIIGLLAKEPQIEQGKAALAANKAQRFLENL